MATIFEKLGEKCTNTKCTKCPVWIFNNEGAGVGLHNGCPEAMRFPSVGKAVEAWLIGADFDRKSLNYFGDERDQEVEE